MLKTLIWPLMLSLLCYGLWLTFSAYQYQDRIAAASEWNTLEGRILERSEATGDANPGNPLSWVKVLVCDPYMSYSYKIEGNRYEGVVHLPPVLTPVRLFTRDMDQQTNTFESVDFDESLALQRDYSNKNPREMVDMRKHIAMEGGKVRLRNLNELADAAKVTEEERDIWRPKVKIKYRPSDPNESITEKDEIEGFRTILLSGVSCIVLSILGAGCLLFHSWVMSNTDDDIEPYGRTLTR